MKHCPCNQPDKEKYADCFDCLIWHHHENSGLVIPESDSEGRVWMSDIIDNSKRWICRLCGEYSATKPACPSCREKEKAHV